MSDDYSPEPSWPNQYSFTDDVDPASREPVSNPTPKPYLICENGERIK